MGLAKLKTSSSKYAALVHGGSRPIPFPQYADDPVGFFKNELGIELTNEQTIIAESVRDRPITNVKAAHGTGKSFIASLLVIYFLFCVGGVAITTAPSEDQVKWILWAELRKIHGLHKTKLGGRCDIMQLLFSETVYAFGITSRDYSENSFQGQHRQKQLLIEDEADGITPQIDNGFIACLTGSDNRGLRIGNPVDPQSQFAKTCKLDKRCLTVSAFSHPNVSWAYELCADGVYRLKPEVAEHIINEDGEIKPQQEWPPEFPRDRIPGAISIDWIERVRREKFETSAYWKGRVMGEYAEDAADGIILLTLLKQARSLYDQNPQYWDAIAKRYPWRLGLDVGDGGDPHALALLRGPVLYEVQIHPTKGDLLDTERAADIAASQIKLLGTGYSIAVDNTGVGAGTLAKLKKTGYQALPCRFGDVPSYKKKKQKEEPKQKFTNLKAELYWQFRELLMGGRIAIAPLENEEYVFQDLTATRYSTNTKDEIFCEPKDKTKSRLGRSPDSEAVIIALTNPMELGGVPQDAATALQAETNSEMEELHKLFS
ncbi:hypothetical protein [Nostoc punctiforme]|uniref:Uncharacterized protein n=2 Tax=Nostoc punctiforme TaxID=272131 RepID=B2ITB2_NOSP7|nr:hypothetical protein [Nostoc punctiforme]ACC81143.1 hypothetical protein Npun_R2589 [Nostoc punctiforme PCC 73102]RCJ29192.1 hypothetical protein A6769_35955 [Nostoc punctiforme NIES-2108]